MEAHPQLMSAKIQERRVHPVAEIVEKQQAVIDTVLEKYIEIIYLYILNHHYYGACFNETYNEFIGRNVTSNPGRGAW